MSPADGAHLIPNGGPPLEPTPFDLARNAVEDLYGEAKNWWDGTAIADQRQADTVSLLLDQLRKAHKDADSARKVEAKPFDDGKAEVQGRYNPLLKRADTAMDGCKAVLGVWLRKLDTDKRARERLAREEADRQRREAEAAIRAAQPDDLEAREAAEAQAESACRAEAEARRAERDRAQAKGGARAVGLRSYFEPVLTDVNEAVKHYWRTNPEAFDAFVLQLAKADVMAGKRTIPGFAVREERRAA